jgi:predicted transcriptional regulator YdeE
VTISVIVSFILKRCIEELPMTKAKRLLALMDKMNTGRKYTVGELALEFQVSYRTMLRDLQELGELGLPIYSENGVHGGYQVLKRERTSPVPTDEPFCRYIDVPAFHAVGFKYTMPLPSTGEAQVLIPRLWLQLEQRIGDIGSLVDRNKRTSVIFHRSDEATVHVCYEVPDVRPLPADMVGLSVPGRNYILYTHKGAMDKANRLKTGQRASDWIAQSGIQLETSFSVEWYDDTRFDPYSPTNEFHFLRALLSENTLPIKVWPQM